MAVAGADLHEALGVRLIARQDARRRLLDEVLSFFGGQALPMMAQLVEAGKLTRGDLRAIEKAIETHEQQGQARADRPVEPKRRRQGRSRR